MYTSKTSARLVGVAGAIAIAASLVFAAPATARLVSDDSGVRSVRSATARPALRSSHAGSLAADHVIVRFASQAGVAATARRHGLDIATDIQRDIQAGDSVSVVSVPDGTDAAAFASELEQDSSVLWAEPDYVMTVDAYTSTPNDPAFSDTADFSSGSQVYPDARAWWLKDQAGSTKASLVWPDLVRDGAAGHARASGSQVKVAVIDTGFYFNHPDAGSNIVAGYDYFESYSSATGFVTDGDVTPIDPSAPGTDIFSSSHGTCIAGQIAGATGNGGGTSSVGYDNQVVVYKVQGRYMEAGGSIPVGAAVIFTSRVAAAIRGAADDGARVINLSLGSSAYSQTLQDAIDYAYANGVLVVAAAGNGGNSTLSYPAAGNNVLAVGSYDLAGASGTSMARSTFSNWGEGLDLMAPGRMIYGFILPGWDEDGAGTDSQPGYAWWQGTSMASPNVAGIAALVWRFVPDLSADEVADVLTASAEDMGAAGYDTGTGYGAVRARAAVDELVRRYPVLAAPAVSAPQIAAGAQVDIEWSAVGGYKVTYDVQLDGETVAKGVTERKLSLQLAEGAHVVSVQAVSPRNWSDSRSTGVAVVRLDTTAPSAPQISVSESSASWICGETGVHGHEVRIDGGEIVATTGHWYSLAGLADGAHVIEVRTTDVAGNVGPWGRVDVEWPLLAGLAAPTDVARVASATRFSTAVDIARKAFDPAGGRTWPGVTDIIIASGEDRAAADPLAASGLAWAYDAPLFLVRADSTPAEVIAAVREIAKASERKIAVHVVGGPASVPDARAREIVAAAGVGEFQPTDRLLATGNRYDLARAIALRMQQVAGADAAKELPGTVLVANGADPAKFFDALALSPISANTGAPILLVSGTQVPAATRSALAALAPSRVIVGGGPSTVSGAVVRSLQAERWSGATRYSTAIAIGERAIAAGMLEPTAVGIAAKLPDALSGGSMVGRAHGILLLTSSAGLDPATSAWLEAHSDDVRSCYVFGGERSVSRKVAGSVSRALR
ncbi:MAG: S8 family serine peptidase [Actinomycetota bacterium]|nr:S8 family serine peptidase [Actinomycetota bacterium]